MRRLNVLVSTMRRLVAPHVAALAAAAGAAGGSNAAATIGVSSPALVFDTNKKDNVTQQQRQQHFLAWLIDNSPRHRAIGPDFQSRGYSYA